MDHNNQQQYTPGSLPRPIPDPPASTPAVPAQGAVAQDSTSSSSSSSLQTAPQTPTNSIAHEGDTIDAGWVAQVDGMIKQTVADPRVLSQEFAKLKAQYIAGRYGREIKQADKKG
jgi:hypothetical protein